MTLTGACNRCGSCCAGPGWRCEHLVTHRPVGLPYATACAVYRQRYNGMPTRLLHGTTGALLAPSVCLKDSQAETAAILALGMGRGCSLTVETA